MGCAGPRSFVSVGCAVSAPHRSSACRHGAQDVLQSGSGANREGQDLGQFIDKDIVMSRFKQVSFAQGS